MSFPLGQRRSARTAACGAVVAAFLASTGTAYALWPATGAGGGSAAARQLPVPTVTATCATVDSIDVTWTSETTPIVASFVVARSTDGGASWTTIASPLAVADTTSYSVTDSALTEATYTYRVTTHQSAWSGTGGLSPSRTVLAAITTGRPANRRPASCT